MGRGRREDGEEARADEWKENDNKAYLSINEGGV